MVTLGDHSGRGALHRHRASTLLVLVPKQGPYREFNWEGFTGVSSLQTRFLENSDPSVLPTSREEVRVRYLGQETLAVRLRTSVAGSGRGVSVPRVPSKVRFAPGPTAVRVGARRSRVSDSVVVGASPPSLLGRFLSVRDAYYTPRRWRSGWTGQTWEDRGPVLGKGHYSVPVPTRSPTMWDPLYRPYNVPRSPLVATLVSQGGGSLGLAESPWVFRRGEGRGKVRMSRSGTGPWGDVGDEGSR